MKKLSSLLKVIVPIVTLIVGLLVGLGVGQLQMKKEEKIFQDKMREASKKIAFMQKKMVEEKTEATVSLEQRYQNDLDKVQNEKKALGEQLGKMKEQVRNLQTKMETEMEAKIKQTEELSTKTKKELQEERQKYTQLSQRNKDLEREQEKMTAEKKALQSDLEKTTRNLGRCEVNNAKLCIIAEELVNAYRNKGIGAAILQKEPLTEIKKVELEQLAEKYRQEIEQQRIKKK
jgi:predicted RND superfamily exporter protein